MKKFKEIYLVEYEDYAFGILIVDYKSQRNATLKYYFIHPQTKHVSEMTTNTHPYEEHEEWYRGIVKAAEVICKENDLVLWVY